MQSAVPPSGPVRVGLITDHAVVRAGVLGMLGPYADRVVIVEIGAESDLGGADLVLYDVLRLSHGDGKDLETAVKAHPGRVLALARELQPGLAARALGMGAITSVSLGADADELVRAVEDFAAGRLEDGSQTDLDHQADQRRQQGRDVNLSPREIDVLGLIVRGRSNEEISEELYITINTVKTLIRSVYRKIDVTTRAQAVAWGVEHGFPTAGSDGS